MAFTYPIELPATNCIQAVDMRAVNVDGIGQSPFTLKQQVYEYSGEMWTADVSLKPMRRSEAEQWLAFLLSLNGRNGTFLLYDPFACQNRGTAQSANVIGSAGDRTISVAMTGTLLAGDYIQIGTGSSARLHKVLQDQNGTGDLEIWPALRATHAGTSVVMNSSKGLFRLTSPEQGWTVNELAAYGITFGAMEAL